jgi:hypothetical protein
MGLIQAIEVVLANERQLFRVGWRVLQVNAKAAIIDFATGYDNHVTAIAKTHVGYMVNFSDGSAQPFTQALVVQAYDHEAKLDQFQPQAQFQDVAFEVQMANVRQLLIAGYPPMQVIGGQLFKSEFFEQVGQIDEIEMQMNMLTIRHDGHQSLQIAAKKIKQRYLSAEVKARYPQLDDDKIKLFHQLGAGLLANINYIDAVPQNYVVLDCEFAQRQANDQAGLTTGIKQLAAMSYCNHEQGTLFFNQYIFDSRYTDATLLAGLKATNQTYTDFQVQGASLVVIKKFIHEVLAQSQCLVFYDCSNDLKHLRAALKTHHLQLTAYEIEVLNRHFDVFDLEAQIVAWEKAQGLSNVQAPSLHTVSILFGIYNHHRHNALWDVATIQQTLVKFSVFSKRAVCSVTRPQPLVVNPATSKRKRRYDYAQIWRLYQEGSTAAEIASMIDGNAGSIRHIVHKLKAHA